MNINRREFIAATAAAVTVGSVIKASTPAPNVFSTGFPSLDKALDGGLQPGEIMVVMGLPGTGKTRFMERIANSQSSGDITNRKNGDWDMLSLWRHPDRTSTFRTEAFLTTDAGWPFGLEGDQSQNHFNQRYLREWLKAKQQYNFAAVASFPLRHNLHGSMRVPRHVEVTAFYYCDYVLHLMPYPCRSTGSLARCLGSRNRKMKGFEFPIAFNQDGCYEVLPDTFS
jgi:hypothetical protein